MSEHRNTAGRFAASSTRGRRRWTVGLVAVVGAGGLALGALGAPVAANDLDTTGKVHASAAVEGDCVTAAAGTGPAEESVSPHQDSQLQASGQGTATVTVCRDAVDPTPPGDPGDPLPGEPGDIVPDDPAGQVDDVVTGALEDGVPDDGDGFPPSDPGDALPGGGEVVPGDVGGLVPDGSGLVQDLLDRLAQITRPALGGGGPDGNDDDGPAMNPSPSGTASGSVDVGGASTDANAGDGSPMGPLPGAELGRGEPDLVSAVAAPAGSLPRTGGGPGSGVLRLIAFLGLGRALFRLAIRRTQLTP